MKRNNIRHFNIRSPFLAFVGLLLGVVLCYNLVIKGKEYFLLPIYIILSVAIVFLVVAIIISLNKKKKIYRIDFQKCLKYCSCIIVVVISFFLGVFVTNMTLNELKSKDMQINDSGRIVATIDKITTYEYGTSLILKDIKFENEDISVELISNGSLYLSGEHNFEIGSVVSVRGDIISNNVFDTDDVSKVIDGVGYTIVVDNVKDVQILENKQSFKNGVLNGLKTILADNMTETNTNLAYSMLFGDKSVLDKSLYSTFDVAGVTHLLCVSGLHVGVLSGIVYLLVHGLLKKLKVGYKIYRWLCFVSVASVLFFYAYLCGFAVSVMRATIMSLVLLFTRVWGFRYDVLNSLSIAGVLILLFSPLSLFEVGFQLSFSCIFAIITLAPELCKLLDKIKVPRFISSPLGASICVTLVTFPILANNFGTASFISVVANLFIIPLFTIVFALLFYFLFIALIPFLSWSLIIPSIGLQVVTSIVRWFSNIPFGVVSVFRVGYWVFGLILILAYLSRFFFNSKKIKPILLSFFSIVAVLIIVLNSQSINYNGNQLLLQHNYKNISKIYIDNNSKLVIGVPNKYTNTFCNERKINKIDALLLYDFTINDHKEVNEFIASYNCETVYIHESQLGLFNKIDFGDAQIVCYNTDIIFKNTKLGFVYNNTNDLVFINIETNDGSVGYVVSDNVADLNFISSSLNNEFDLLVCDNEEHNLLDFDFKYDKLVCGSSNIDSNSVQLYRLKEYIIEV